MGEGCGIRRLKEFWKRGFAALLLVAVSAACEREQETPKQVIRPVHAMQVGDFSAFMERSFVGRATAQNEVNLSFRVAGPLVARPVDVGDRVKKGDLVAALDTSTFQADVDRLKGEVSKAEAILERAVLELDRQKKLLSKGWVTQAKIDTVSAVEAASRSGADAARSALERAELDLSYTTLTAPFDGVVVNTFVENFEFVQAQQPILRVLDASNIEFTVFVPEGLISYAPYVTEIGVRFDAFPDLEIAARIKEIGREASQATRTYPVTLVMSQPEGVEILPGMAGKADIKSQPPETAKEGGIEVPATAVFTDEDTSKSYVWVVSEADKTLSRREVEVGGLSRFGARISGGIEPGEWIVTKGVNSVKEGQTVRILDEDGQGSSS